MMFDEYVIDGEAYERLRHPGDRTWLREWSELLSALDADGSLVVEDVGALASARSHVRGAMLRQDLRRPARWWRAMIYYNSVAQRADRLLGSSPTQADRLAWQFDPDNVLDTVGPDGESHSLAVVLSEAESPTSDAHRQLLGVAENELRAQLREVNACIVACQELDVAPMMWAPYRGYMEAKFSNEGQAAQQAATQFFSIAFPAYAPTGVRDFVKVRSHKDMTALRSEIMRATKSEDVLDREYPQRVLEQVLRIEMKGTRMRRIAGWVSTFVGNLPVPIPGLSLGSSVAAEGLSGLIDRRRRKPWRWFYVISDGRGLT
jgi:hypothetical protein